MNTTLRELAQKAKFRLRAMSSEANPILKYKEDKLRTYGEACLSAKVQYAIIVSQKKVQDDPLYAKVKKMLMKDIDVMNPLEQIIEHHIYDELNDKQKEKYMFKLSKRYAQIKEFVVKELMENEVELGNI